MADDVILKEILTKLTVEADEALQDMERVRVATQEIKMQLRDLGAVSLESLKVVSESFKANLESSSGALGQLRAQIAAVKHDIKLLSSPEGQIMFGGTGMIDEMKAKLASLERQYSIMVRSMATAQKELGASFRQQAEEAKNFFFTAQMGANRFRLAINMAKAELRLLMQEGRSIDDAFEGLRVAGRYEARQLSQAMREVRQETAATRKEFSTLGNVSNRVFRSIMGFIVLNILRRVLDLFGELADEARKLARSIVDVSIAVRQLQREGTEITQLEVVKYVSELRSQFGLFTTRELNEGIGALFNLGRQLSFTKDQMFALAQATAVAAVRTGVDYKEAIDRVTRALSTGQTRGLVELQFAISEAAIAEEALRMGLAETAGQLTRNQKALALYNLILEQSTKLEKDAALIQQTTVGEVQASEAAVTDLKESIGKLLLPVKQRWLWLIQGLLTGLNSFLNSIKTLDDFLRVNLTATFQVSGEVIRSWWNALLGRGEAMSIDDLVDRFKEIQQQVRDAIALEEGFLGDETIGEAVSEIEGAGEDLTDAYDNLFIKLRESIIDGNNAVEAENRRFLDKLVEDAMKYALKLKQLADKLAFDRAKIERDYQDKVSDINNDARRKEIEAEEKFQDRLRRLRNQFILDLEEALQERDAKQILRLIRRFNMRKSELERQRDDERKDLEQQRQDELADLQKQRERRLRELDLEFEFRRNKMEEQYALERKLAQMDHEQKLRELRIRTDERNNEILRRFSDEYDITDEWARAIGDRLNAEFGPGGRVEAIYRYMLEYAYQVMTQLSAIPINFQMGSVREGIIDLENERDRTGPGLRDEPPATNAPVLPPIYDRGGPFSAPFSMTPTNAEGKVMIEVMLTKDLEGRIIDQTKTELADVFLRVSR